MATAGGMWALLTLCYINITNSHFSQLDPQLKKVSTFIGYLLTDGLIV